MLFILSCFSCGTTETCTVSEPEIPYCAGFACNSWCVFLYEVLVGCWFGWVFFQLHVKKQEILLHLGLFAVLLYLFNHYGIVNVLLCQLNNVFMARVKFLGRVFCELQLYYIIVMPDSVMVGEVCLCPWFSFLKAFDSLNSAFSADMQHLYSPKLANHALELLISFEVHFFPN